MTDLRLLGLAPTGVVAGVLAFTVARADESLDVPDPIVVETVESTLPTTTVPPAPEATIPPVTVVPDDGDDDVDDDDDDSDDSADDADDSVDSPDGAPPWSACPT